MERVVSRPVVRVRRAVILGGFAVLAVILAAVAVADPFNLRWAAWWTAGTVALALLLVTFALVALAPARILRTFLAVLGLVLTAGWVVAVLLLVQWGGPAPADVRELAADGGLRAVLVTGQRDSPDSGPAVVVRSGSGPFEQQSLVWSGTSGTPEPDGAAFVDGMAEIQLGTCSFAVPVEPVTLEAVPILQGAGAGGC